MALVVELLPEQLCVRAIHRLLARPRGAPTCGRRSRRCSTCRDAGPNDADGVAALEAAMRTRGALGLVDADGLALLVPTPALDALARRRSPRRSAASTRRGSRPACSRRSPAPRSPTATTPRTVAAAVEKGDAEAAVLLRPVDVDTIRAAADAGLRMPEKTTFFAPKPRTGMVFRSLDG